MKTPESIPGTNAPAAIRRPGRQRSRDNGYSRSTQLTPVTPTDRVPAVQEDDPGDRLEFERRFASDQACRQDRFKLRWPNGLVCPRWGGREAWPTQRGLWVCAVCPYQASVTAATILQDTRKPLTLGFRVMWWVTTRKNGGRPWDCSGNWDGTGRDLRGQGRRGGDRPFDAQQGSGAGGGAGRRPRTPVRCCRGCIGWHRS